MAFYTCTMNLAIDLFIETQQLLPHTVNRTIDDDIQANGKGVNVSLVLKQLGIDTTALGFSAGFTGNYIADYLAEKAIKAEFIQVPGMTRINVFTQVNETKEEFKLVNQGPVIPEIAVTKLLQQISRLKTEDYLCISGSLPRGVDPEIFITISKLCKQQGVRLVIDSSYNEILECLQYQPFLLKPNEEELAEWFELEEPTTADYIKCAVALVKRGAKNVLLSLGGEGAVFVNEQMLLMGSAPKGKVVNTACAGDTLLGTFLAGLVQEKTFEDCLKHSIAAGSSTAFQKGLTDFSDVDFLEKQIVIKKGESELWQNIN